MAEQGFESGIRLPVSTLTLLAMIIAGGVGYGSLRTEVGRFEETSGFNVIVFDLDKQFEMI